MSLRNEKASEREDLKSMLEHLEDEYRRSSISETSYSELKRSYLGRLREIEQRILESAHSKGMLGLGQKKEEKTESNAEAKTPDKKEPQPTAEGPGGIKLYGAGTDEDPYRTTPEKQAPQQQEEVETPAEPKQEVTDAAVQIELEKLKVMIENIRATKQTTDDTIRAMSESIGELRSLVFQSDASFKEVEAKLEKLEDDVGEMRPQEMAKKFRDLGTALEALQISMEKLEKKNEDVAVKVNHTNELMRSIGGIENLVEINRTMQKKTDEVREVMRYIERLANKAEKSFLEINKGLDELMIYKIKQDSMFDTMNEQNKAIDAINVRFDSYESKKDLQRFEEDMLLLKKQVEEINKQMPMTKLNIPEPILALRKERDDILMFVASLDEQLHSRKISASEYARIREENGKKIAALEAQISEQWKSVLKLLNVQPPAKAEPAVTDESEGEAADEKHADASPTGPAAQEKSVQSDTAALPEKPVQAEKVVAEPAKKKSGKPVKEKAPPTMPDTKSVPDTKPDGNAPVAAKPSLPAAKPVMIEAQSEPSVSETPAVKTDITLNQESPAPEPIAAPTPEPKATETPPAAEPPIAATKNIDTVALDFSRMKKKEMLDMLKGVRDRI